MATWADYAAQLASYRPTPAPRIDTSSFEANATYIDDKKRSITFTINGIPIILNIGDCIEYDIFGGLDADGKTPKYIRKQDKILWFGERGGSPAQIFIGYHTFIGLTHDMVREGGTSDWKTITKCDAGAAGGAGAGAGASGGARRRRRRSTHKRHRKHRRQSRRYRK